jgi:putative AdoMet-dependent methyltransferase
MDVWIHEMARRLKTTPRTIRFYEEKGLISPDKSPESGYRQFSEQDAWRLQTILALREVGMPVSRIREVLNEIDQGDREEALYYLQLQRAVLYGEWLRLKRVISTLDRMIDRFDADQAGWDDLWELAEQSRRADREREKWRDIWDFDRIAPIFDERVRSGEGWWRIHRDYDRSLDLVVEQVNPRSGETGLEIGVGTGNLAGRFLQKGIRMCGIDQSREMLKICRRKYPEMTAVPGNFLAIPWPDDTFDFVVSSYAFHLLSDGQKAIALEEIDRVLKPDGRVCLLDVMMDETRMEDDVHFGTDPREEMKNRFPARIPWLTEELERLGYTAETERIHEGVWLVLAVKRA